MCITGQCTSRDADTVPLVALNVLLTASEATAETEQVSDIDGSCVRIAAEAVRVAVVALLWDSVAIMDRVALDVTDGVVIQEAVAVRLNDGEVVGAGGVTLSEALTIGVVVAVTDSVLRVGVAPLRLNDGRTVAVGVGDGAAVSVTVALPDGVTDSVLRVGVAPLRLNVIRTVRESRSEPSKLRELRSFAKLDDNFKLREVVIKRVLLFVLLLVGVTAPLAEGVIELGAVKL